MFRHLLAIQPSKLAAQMATQNKGEKNHFTKGDIYWVVWQVIGRAFVCLLLKGASWPSQSADLYCQSKARYCWNIFRNISPYDLIGRGVDCLPAPIHHNFLSYKACLYPFQSTSQNYWQHQSLNFTSFSTKLTVSSMRGTLTSS